MATRWILEKTSLKGCRRKVVKAFQGLGGVNRAVSTRQGGRGGKLVVNITVVNQRGNKTPASGLRYPYLRDDDDDDDDDDIVRRQLRRYEVPE